MRRRTIWTCLCLVMFIGGERAAIGQQSVTTLLLSKDLAEFRGKEATVSTVDFPAGVASPAHRHDAHTFVYVLQGSVVMQVAGGPTLTLGPGQTFYETPTDIHVTSRNASASEPARILVFMIKDKDKPAVRPAK